MKDDLKNAPSEMFEGCVRSSGSIVIDCELCGRTHFGTGGDFEEGEFEGLVKKAEAQPDKYIQHFDDDMVSYGYVQGQQCVIGCPCNGLYRFESWILRHKFLIMDYLMKYASEKCDKAFKLHNAAFQTQAMMEELKKMENKPNGKIRQFDLE